MWTTVNDPIDPQGLYVLLGVQKGAFNRQEVFKRERCLFSLSGKISVEVINSKISRQISTSMSESSFRVLPQAFFELDIEQDSMHNLC